MGEGGERDLEVPGLSIFSSKTKGFLQKGEFFIADSATFKYFSEGGVGVW